MPRAGFLFVATRGYSSLQGGAAPVAEPRLQVHGFQQLQLTGSAAPRHVGSSQTRNQTRVPCNGRQILICCTTRDVHLETTLKKRIIPWQRHFPLIQWQCKLAWSKSSWVRTKTWVMRKARIRPQSFKEKTQAVHPRLCVPGWRRAGCFRPEPNVLFIGAYSTYSKHTKFPLVTTAFISIINSFISHYNLVTINSSACWQHPKSKPHVEMNTNVVWFPRRPISLTHQVEQLKLW